jgi:hypothetical protein
MEIYYTGSEINRVRRCELDSSGSGKGLVTVCEYGNETSGSVKGVEFLD